MENNNSIDEQAIEDFETAWTAAPFPNIDDFLPDSSGDTFLGTLLELVIIDLEFRWKQVGATIDVGANHVPDQLEQYIARYPQLTDDETIRRLAEEEFAIRRKYGDQPSAASFLRRFPQLRERIEQLDTQYPLTEVRRPTVRKRVSQPSTIEHYELHQVVGEGGMGSVYLAHQKEPVRRQVAVKVIRAGFDSHDVIARFEAERQALAMMDHQHIARVYDAGTTDQGLPFLTMEYVDGIPITDYCSRNKLSVPERLHLFKDVCSAVQHAHQKGVLHRDLKPSNVLIAEEDGRPVAKVIDFGLAKAVDAANLLTDKTIYTHAGQVLGTLKYMSPEQAATQEKDVDTRADVYALGVMLYELLTGETPLDEASIREQGVLSVLEMIRDHEPVRPSARLAVDELSSQDISAELGTSASALRQVLRGDLDWVVMKALEKDRERRYESASSLADDVRRFLSNEPVQARPPSASYRLQKFVRKNRLLVTSSILFMSLLLAGMMATTWQAIRATKAEKAASEQEAIAVANAAESERRRVEVVKATRERSILLERSEYWVQLFMAAAQTNDDNPTRMPLPEILKARKSLRTHVPWNAAARIVVLQHLASELLELGEFEQAAATAQEACDQGMDNWVTLDERSQKSLAILRMAYAAVGNSEKADRISRILCRHEHVLDARFSFGPLYLANIGGTGLGVPGRLFESERLKRLTRSYEGNYLEALIKAEKLAEACWQGGRNREASGIFEELCDKLKGTLATKEFLKHPARYSLASSYLIDGEHEKAIELYREILDSGANNDPLTPWVEYGLARAYFLSGDVNRAIAIYEKWNKQPNRALAEAYAEAGRPRLAAKVYLQLAEDVEQQFGSRRAKRHWEQLLETWMWAKEFEEAEQVSRHLREVVVPDQRKNSVGLATVGTSAKVQYDEDPAGVELAIAWAGQGRFADAEAAIRRSLGHETISKEDRWRLKSALALCLAEKKSGQEDVKDTAVQAFEQLHQSMSQMPANHRWCVARACERLIRICEIEGRVDEVNKWKKRLPELEEERIKLSHAIR